MIISIVTWLKSYNKDEQIVESKRLSNIQLSIISGIMFLLCIIVGYYMNNYTDNTQLYMDVFSTNTCIYRTNIIDVEVQRTMDILDYN